MITKRKFGVTMDKEIYAKMDSEKGNKNFSQHLNLVLHDYYGI